MLTREQREAHFATERLPRGWQTELRVAARILPLGLWVKMGEPFTTARLGEALDDQRCPNQADIRVEGGHLLEVKGRGFPFTTPADYPYETAFVGACRRWEKRTELPCAVVLFSEPTDSLLAVPIRTRSRWVEESCYDRQRDFPVRSLAAPRECLRTEAQLLAHLRRPCDAQA